MGKLSLHVHHYKATQLVGIDRHNRRLGKNHSNKQIDPEKSKDNITLKVVEKSLYQDAKKRIEEEVIAKGNRVTKASVWVTEICCTLPEGIERERSEEYFRAIVDYFEEANGKDNILAAYIHNDESERNHLHLDIQPIQDGHLTMKKVWTRKRLIEIHDKLPAYLRERGFEVERGDRLDDFESKNKANMPLRKYKIYQEKEKLKQQYNSLVTDYNKLADQYNRVVTEKTALQRKNLCTAQNLLQESRSRSL